MEVCPPPVMQILTSYLLFEKQTRKGWGGEWGGDKVCVLRLPPPSSGFHKQNVRAQLQPVVVQRGAEGAVSHLSALVLGHSSATWDVCVSL